MCSAPHAATIPMRDARVGHRRAHVRVPEQSVRSGCRCRPPAGAPRSWDDTRDTSPVPRPRRAERRGGRRAGSRSREHDAAATVAGRPPSRGRPGRQERDRTSRAGATKGCAARTSSDARVRGGTSESGSSTIRSLPRGSGALVAIRHAGSPDTALTPLGGLAPRDRAVPCPTAAGLPRRTRAPSSPSR